ncbi:MAG: hypothetical protein KF862_11120 [Chitinophagaceae bacterium]|nr:hypothetical protein [Chitinophagaceae bacterium]
MYDNIQQYADEQVYPAKYDTIIGFIGYERVEIELMKAGRISSSQIKLGKAKKTIIEYDDQKIIIDSLVSWVNITGLTQPKLYRIQIYTIDEFDNKSVPQEIALIPYTQTDFQSLAVSSPKIMASPTAAVIEWPNGLSSTLLDYTGLSYEYTDKDNEVRKGTREESPRFVIANLTPSQEVTVNVTYKVIPKINSSPIIDTLDLTVPITLVMPTETTPFSPAERAILEANGVTEFTSAGVSGITKLTYPVHANSLQDIFYFANLKELDLTGGTLFTLPTLTYDRNGAQSTVGGGSYAPYLAKVSDIASSDMQALKDLLELGLLDKVKYTPNSMGLDEILAPYVQNGVVELVETPDEALIDPVRFSVNGLVQDGQWKTDITYPAADAPSSSGLQNIIKAVVAAKNATMVFALPKEYRFNVKEYKYVKFKVYAPAKSTFTSPYEPYQRLWPRIMNYMWSFSGNSDFGQEYWDYSADNFKIADADLQKWTDVTIDLSPADGKHNRVILLNIGGEPNITFDAGSNITYYFSDFRFSKE